MQEKRYLVGEEGNSEPAITVATSARPPLSFHKRERGREGRTERPGRGQGGRETTK